MSERILVVEDESALCANIARALGRAGHSVTAVERGKDAIDELSSARDAGRGIGPDDVVRHRLVRHIVDAYDRHRPHNVVRHGDAAGPGARAAAHGTPRRS